MNVSKLMVISATACVAVVFTVTLVRQKGSPPDKPVAPVAAVNPPILATHHTVVRNTARAPEPGLVQAALQTKPTDWNKEFEQSHDFFSLVRAAAPSGLRGDGAASRTVAKALYMCIGFKAQFQNSVDPVRDFNAYMDGMTKAPDWALAKIRANFDRCKGFLSGDAFAELPARDGGYESVSFWNAQAIANNDPTSEAQNAASLISTNLEAAQASIDKAVASHDPDALLLVGKMLSDGHFSTDRLQGFAVALAACDLGANCSGESNGTTYADTVRRMAGDAGYAQAYAQAQAFEDALSRGDPGTVQRFVKLNPSK